MQQSHRPVAVRHAAGLDPGYAGWNQTCTLQWLSPLPPHSACHRLPQASCACNSLMRRLHPSEAVGRGFGAVDASPERWHDIAVRHCRVCYHAHWLSCSTDAYPSRWEGRPGGRASRQSGRGAKPVNPVEAHPICGGASSSHQYLPPDTWVCCLSTIGGRTTLLPAGEPCEAPRTLFVQPVAHGECTPLHSKHIS
jgi:hypothetical protein